MTRKLRPGDRVEFTEEALDLCDPAISDDETMGTILEILGQSLVLVQFDDKEPPVTCHVDHFDII